MNKIQKYYRVSVNGIGIYEAVDKSCSKDDLRKKDKPDGSSWLPKRGVDFPEAVSFWTEKGFQKYKDSGLFFWHQSVVDGEVFVEEISRPENILYEDEYQIIFKRTH